MQMLAIRLIFISNGTSEPHSTVGNMSDCRSCFASSIPAQSHNFMEIDHKIISMAKLLPSADSKRVVVSYKRKYLHEVLVNLLVKNAKLARKKVWLGELTVPT